MFNFNHIDKNKTKEEIQEIKELYKFYLIDIGVIKKLIHTTKKSIWLLILYRRV